MRSDRDGGNDPVAPRTPEHGDAIPVLRGLVTTLGFSHVVYLLAQLADEEGDLAKAHEDAVGVHRAALNARVLGETAMRLLG
jgi:hypothetical protein